MNIQFKKNMTLMKKHSASINKLPKKFSQSIKIQATSSGDKTIWFNNSLIHSKYNPVKEGQTFAGKVKPGSQICLYGFGLGYHIESLLKKIGPSGSLLTIELNPDLLLAAIMLRDHSKILCDKRFHLVFGFDEDKVAKDVARHMKQLQSNPGSLEVLFHIPSFRCIPPNFPRLTNSLEVLLMERRFPAVLGNIEKENFLLNKEIAKKSTGINFLLSKHKGKPGLLVSAGPSLDEILPYLKQVGENAIIGCVDTAMPILSREGISPEYVFSLDPQEDSFDYFQENLGSEAKLIFTPTANSKIVHCYRGEKFIIFKLKHTKYSEDETIINDKGSTETGGSVSCLALDALVQFGCNPVFLIGQDLSFPNNRSYSSFSNNNKQMLDKLDNHNPLTKTHYAKSQENKTIHINTNDGRKVLTNQVMYSYLRTIEQIASQNPETKIYNLCSHGAKIDHVTSLGSVKEVLKFLVNRH